MRIQRQLAPLALGLGLLALGCIGVTRGPGRLPPMDPLQRSLLESGMAAYDDGQYPQAIRIFQGLIAQYSGSPLLPEAQWMLGRTYERPGDWKRALWE